MPKSEVQRELSSLRRELLCIREIGEVLASGLGVNVLFEELVGKLSSALHAERSTLFLFDRDSQTIWSKIAQGEEGRIIKLSLGEGLAGWVAENSKPLNIADAYEDPRFNQAVDAKTGFRTRSVIAVPILGTNAELLGVIQALNSAAGTFTEEDLQVLTSVASQLAFAVENAALSQRLLDQNAELKSARDAAEAASKTKSTFLANVSHEIRTPMNGLMGLLDLVLDTTMEDSQREHLTLARRSADSLLRLMNDLLDFSKIEASQIEIDEVAFDLVGHLRDTLHMMEPKALAKGLRLELQAAAELPTIISTDPGRLRQVLLNLLSNALKFTAEGSISVQVALGPQDESGVAIRFSVADTGIGIPKGKQGRIFDAFAQGDESTSRRFGGTGLGLSISSRLVELLGGSMWVESAADEGSTFHFDIRAKIPSAVYQDAIPDTTPGGSRILILTEHAQRATQLEDLFVRWKMRPSLARSATSAVSTLEAAERSGAPIAVVVVDYGSASLAGFETVRFLQEAPVDAKPRIVVMSALGRIGDGSLARKLGVAAYLTRPTSTSDLLDAITTVLGPNRELVTKHSLRESRHSLSVLVAEDNATNQLLARRLLELRGHRVTVVGDGQAALAAFEATPYDIILMDIQMAGSDGLEATRGIREAEQRLGGYIPIAAVTADAIAHRRAEFIEAGMNAYIPKPFDARELFYLVEFLGRHQALFPRGQSEGLQSVVNWRAVVSRFHGDEKVAFERVQEFLSDAARHMKALWNALELGDRDRIGRCVEEFKASAAISELSVFLSEADQLHAAAEGLDLPVLRARYWGIQFELSRVSALLARSPPSELSRSVVGS